jgi:pimeloyl-ACP methyl ester carboxylesterase
MGIAAAWVALTVVLTVPTMAQQRPEPFRPLILVPGILGTELLDEDDSVVWGNAGSLWNFSKLEIDAEGNSPLHPGHLIKSVNVLGPFWTIHQYDGLLSLLQELNYVEGKNLFIFYYDWRRSNFDNADKLKKLIGGNPALKGQPIDILAHSMGGLIARIYLQQNPETARVTRLISLAVPHRGSMNALAEMTNGWGGFENLLAGGIGTIRRVMFSFPSLFELFPNYDRCCRVGVQGQEHLTYFDPTEPDRWTKGDWIPVEYRSGARLRNVLSALANAKKIKALLSQPLPSDTELTLIAGDRFSTDLYLYVDPNDASWQRWKFSTSVGDGTVPLWSAAASDWPGRSLPAFVDHATIFDDQWVQNLLKRMLNKNAGPPPIAATSLPLARTAADRLIEISLVKLNIDKVVVRAGDQSQFAISITTVDPVAKGDLAPKLNVDGPSGPIPEVLQEITSDDDVNHRTLSFTGAVQTSTSGAYSLHLVIPGLGGTYTRDIVALSQNP